MQLGKRPGGTRFASLKGSSKDVAQARDLPRTPAETPMLKFKKRHPPPGARPGTLVIDQDAPAPRIRLVRYTAETARAEDDVDVEDLPTDTPPDSVSWIDVQGFGDEPTIQRIGEAFGLHRLVVEDVVKVLTIMASIFIPLTFLAGVYGMNFQNMPELQVWWAYPLLWLVMVLLAVGMLVFFRRKGWIGPARRDPREAED